MGFDTQTMRVGPYRANGREIKGDRARFAQCSFKTTSSQFRRAWDPLAATMLGTPHTPSWTSIKSDEAVSPT